MSAIQLPVHTARPFALRWAYRVSRSVSVHVLDGGIEVDSYDLTSAKVLRAALRRTYHHLPASGALVKLIGIEAVQLPLGIGRARREVVLPGIEAALAFLS
jgi:hypothetical protein